MFDLVTPPVIPAMSPQAIGKVQRLEAVLGSRPQATIPTLHVLHGGMYARTVFLPAGTLITGTLIKIPTLLFVVGHAIVYLGDDVELELNGYNSVPASAGRKQAFLAISGTHLTMVFPSDAIDVAEAERQFTDEADLLLSRRDVERSSASMTGE